MITSEHEAREFCAGRLSSEALQRLDRLAFLLVEESQRQNLVSATSLDCIWQRHFADSLQLVDHVPRETSTLLDLGSGAGFPGLVLAIGTPERPVVLVESRKRRVEIGLSGNGFLHPSAKKAPIGLNPRPPNRAALGSVEHAVMYRGRICRPADQAIERVDLAHQVTLA